MEMDGPHGLSGLTVLPPADVEGSKGADPVMALSHPAPAHQFRRAAACR